VSRIKCTNLERYCQEIYIGWSSMKGCSDKSVLKGALYIVERMDPMDHSTRSIHDLDLRYISVVKSHSPGSCFNAEALI
jgi:hypothetical protein